MTAVWLITAFLAVANFVHQTGAGHIGRPPGGCAFAEFSWLAIGAMAMLIKPSPPSKFDEHRDERMWIRRRDSELAQRKFLRWCVVLYWPVTFVVLGLCLGLLQNGDR